MNFVLPVLGVLSIANVTEVPFDPLGGKCADFKIVVSEFTKAGLEPSMYFLADNGKVLFIAFVQKQTNDWVMLRREAGGPTCLFGHGIGFGIAPKFNTEPSY